MTTNYLNPVESPRTNMFDLSHEHKTTMDMGYLCPTLLLEAMPDDKFFIKPEIMLRFVPLLSPVMHRIKVTQDFFFVPTRIMWKNFKRWITEEYEAEPPYMIMNALVSQIGVGSPLNYLGLPLGLTDAMIDNYKLSAFPITAYNLIYEEYYRDQNLITNLYNATGEPPLVDGANTTLAVNIICHQRAWNHDYFTSALPWAQKGDPVKIPIFASDRAEVSYDNSNQQQYINTLTGLPFAGTGNVNHQSTGLWSSTLGIGTPANIDPNGSIYISDTEAGTIADLRAAFAIQTFLEKKARGGTRFIEYMQQMWGASSSDGRLQRPEFIGRMQQNVVISEVLSTADSGTEVVGGLAGHGISFSSGDTVKWKCEEYGYILGIINVQPVTGYQQGIPKLYRRNVPLDYPLPVFAHLGEQPIYNWEILANTVTAGGQQEGTFGYQPRYDEMRHTYDRASGQMADNYQFWNLNRTFSTLPLLNEGFISCNASKRIFAVEQAFSFDTVIASLYYDVKKISKLPKYGIPELR